MIPHNSQTEEQSSNIEFNQSAAYQNKKRVVIVGAGFGGIATAKALKNANVEVILIDKMNHHVFQPLLYQVAVSALTPKDIAAPIRNIFRKQKNILILLDEAVSIDKEHKRLYLKSKEIVDFDYLIIATGAETSYFSHPEWRFAATGLKTLNDALLIREKVLLAYEMAESARDTDEIKELLTFIVVGGGPTGVELAGSLVEIGNKTLIHDYPNLKNKTLRVILINSGNRILGAFHERLSERAKRDLEKMGVEVMLNTTVIDVSPGYLIYTRDGITEGLAALNIIWAAGNTVSGIVTELKTECDSMGRAKVLPDLSIPEYPNIFVIGDAAHFAVQTSDNKEKGVQNAKTEPLPGLAPVATQQGQYLGFIISKDIQPAWRRPFRYWDKGTMATIGKAKAIAQIGSFKFSGEIAWLLWALIHVALLINFRTKFMVMLEWMWFYFTFRPGARIIYLRDRTN